MSEIYQKIKEGEYTPEYRDEEGKPFNHKLYREQEQKLREQFKKDCFIDLGIENNPKAELLFEKAWDLGHSSGYWEVYCQMQELVELIT